MVTKGLNKITQNETQALQLVDNFCKSWVVKVGFEKKRIVIVVREKGLEPLHRRRQNLNLVRLPISPLPHIERFQMGWLKGLEPLTTGITIRDSTN